MSNTVIKVENLSKQYRLGEVGTGTISHDINRWWAKVRGKEDPFLKLGETNDRTKISNSEYVWALRDINFEVKQGEVLGIIGRNGAGKSTLLKILSKTTNPTIGSIKAKGRIASLLEVGTGFHPEMTGKENIFLNGAILGMTRKEIRKKFDEIVDFAGVERYVDTPVKRYSSGMYVRLAFAVAAHLEPEILIVDEVLAVGDAEFQKKCLGKMKDVSVNDGRTVLFVSHNMGAIQKLCNQAVLLANGALVEIGNTNTVIDTYLKETNKKYTEYIFSNKYENDIAFVTKMVLQDLNGNQMYEIPIGKPWKIRIYFTVLKPINNLIVGLGMVDSFDTSIRTSWNITSNLESGDYVATFVEDNITFSTGQYKFLIGISIANKSLQYIDDNLWFTISDIIDSQEESVINSNNGIILNQMKMYVEKN